MNGVRSLSFTTRRIYVLLEQLYAEPIRASDLVKAGGKEHPQRRVVLRHDPCTQTDDFGP